MLVHVVLEEQEFEDEFSAGIAGMAGTTTQWNEDHAWCVGSKVEITPPLIEPQICHRRNPSDRLKPIQICSELIETTSDRVSDQGSDRACARASDSTCMCHSYSACMHYNYSTCMYYRYTACMFQSYSTCMYYSYSICMYYSYVICMYYCTGT